MAYERLIGSLKQESKVLVSEEIRRRKALLDKLKSSPKSDFEDIYREQKEKLENKQKLM
ncbi:MULTISPECIES: hypothetical protein [unclassified Hydrogenobaculum]|jgi:hypothetical protein|uniref:hypothetical protein n=1 Tax=unclassified Hydrogenobaculum TaxID=2622382 RepID=UPI0001C521F4|nr:MULTISPECIES: hypothetical protein [unclassified Hydrogenobaculum]AEF19390.1 hypothetical protein Hyd3684_1003 [Hydrogenobaculum sp. 3684]AEG46679.1 hypothetical protein HydSHO_1004 [Hydrogenobaculum sp. SHO]AGG15323.1 hypothetical protein HydHO_1008 [Hydrogenobaculum sp. HO]AGH93625.1 hypothetical protein HydSN_1033 [Hydrogenobaculum sp. SN]